MTKIKLDKRNYRRHNDANKKVIRKSLEELGAGRSIVIDNEGEIIAGNGVYEQAKSLGLKVREIETDGSELVVVKRTDLATDDERRKKLALADNAASDTSEWDEELLRADWSEEVLADWGVELPSEIDETETAEAKEDNFDETKEEIEPRVQKGEVWQLGEHRLMCGDSTSAGDVAVLMNGAKADLFVTDPPYGVSYVGKNDFLNSLDASHRLTKAIENDDKKPEQMFDFWKEAFTRGFENTKERMSYYITAPQGGDLLLLLLLQSIRDAGFALKHMMVWNKNNHVLGRCDYNYKHEPIIYGWKIKGTHDFYNKGQFKTSVWDIPKPLKSDLHPTMKPIALIENMLLNNSIEGDAVLDLFGGSGSTLIAAEQLNRKCYMMEIDPHYCDVIIARWEKLTGKTATKAQ